MTPHRPFRRRLPNRDRVRVLLAACSALGIGAVGTLAAWTDQSTATTGTFTAGRLDLKVGTTAANVVDTNPTGFTSFAMSNMAPGSTTTAQLVVNNAGTVPFTYTVSGTATNNGTGANQLGNAVQLQIFPGTSCSGTALNSPAKFTSSTTARAVAAGSSETLCFRATLPSSADSSLQGTSTVGTFTVTATNS